MITPDDDERSALIVRQLGSALVLWSEIEILWSRIFGRLLFFGFKFDPIAEPASPPEDDNPKMDRANALWETILSSAAQIDMVEAIAPLALRHRGHGPLLEQIKAAATLTDETRGLRNAIAHASFQRRQLQSVAQIPGGVEIRVESLGVDLADRPHKRLRGGDVTEQLPRIIEAFNAVLREVRQVNFLLASQPDSLADRIV